VVLDDLKTTSDHRRGRPLLDMYHIVYHQSVHPKNKIQRTFTLPDPTFTKDEEPYSKDIHEHAVEATGGGKFLFQEFGDPLNEIERTEIGPKYRDALLIGFPEEEPGDLQTPSDD